MGRIEWSVRWQIPTPLHMGSGIARPGYADRIVRRNHAGAPELSGEAIKGALRLAAERLCRWYTVWSPESPNDSLPLHPVIARIFGGGAVRYRFSPAAATNVPERGRTFRTASTALDFDGLAKKETLRTIENYASGLVFDVRIAATGDNFADDSQAWRDAEVLTLVLVLTTCIGGKRSAGLGQIECQSISIQALGCRANASLNVTSDLAASWVDRAVQHIKGTQ